MVEAATSCEIQNVFAMGDLNLDLSRTMDTNYRHRQHADETINLTAKGGLDHHELGITWSRTKNEKLMESSIDWLFAGGQVDHTWKKTAGFTDHLMIGFDLHLNEKKPKSKAATVWRRNINRVDIVELQQLLAYSPWQDGVEDNLEMAAERFDKNLKEAWDRVALLRRVEVKARRSVRPSEVLRKLRFERDLAQKRGNVKYRQLRNECTKLTRAEQMRSEVNKIKEGDGKVWQTMNKLTNQGKGGRVVIKENGQYVSDAKAGTAFNNHFIDKVGRLREGMFSGDNPLAATRRRAEKLGLKKSFFFNAFC
jgi:hypothetical protein